MRMCGHRRHYTSFNKGTPTSNIYVFALFDEFGVENCKIELVEEYPCNSKSELEKREHYHIQLNTCVNKLIAGRSGKEYHIENRKYLLKQAKIWRDTHVEERHVYHKGYNAIHKDDISQKHKQYYEQRKDTIIERTRQYYHEHKEDVAEARKKYYQLHKEEARQYKQKHYQENKLRISEHQKEYRNMNRERIAAQRKAKYEDNTDLMHVQQRERYLRSREAILTKYGEQLQCAICNCSVRGGHIARHNKTQKHQKALKQEPEIEP